jgi:hypothetical protein|eukprot:SAG25_NODE_42_length_19413_cov_107.539609_4_plen_227_part_00
MDPSFINRVLYQLTHVEELLAIYSQFATEAQSDWFHLKGKQVVQEHHSHHSPRSPRDSVQSSPQKSKKRSKDAEGDMRVSVPDMDAVFEIDNPVFESPQGYSSPRGSIRASIQEETGKIPIYKFQRTGLLKAADELQDRIDTLDPAVESNSAVIHSSSEANFSSAELLPHTSDVRDLFDELTQSYVLAHAALAVHPEVSNHVRAFMASSCINTLTNCCLLRCCYTD